MGLNAIVNYMAREGLTDHTEGYHAFMRAMHDYYTSEFIRRKSDQSFHGYFDLKLGLKARQFNTLLNDPQAVAAIDQDDIDARAEAYRKASRG